LGGVQSRKTIKAAMTPADKKNPMVKNQTIVTKGLLSEALGILELVIMRVPLAD
jgi:hypothetical protein